MKTEKEKLEASNEIFSSYRPHATIDFVVLEFSASSSTGHDRKTNGQTIKSRLNASYVNAIDATNHGGPATKFRARIQSPVRCDFDSWVKEHVPTATGIKLVSIEISLDFYPPDPGNADMPEIAAFIARALKNRVSDNRRFSGYTDKVTGDIFSVIEIPYTAEAHSIIVDAFSKDRVYFIGNVVDEIHQRLYVKSTDNGESLPVEQHCVRLEITLNNEQLIRQLGVVFDTGKFCLEKAAKYFYLLTLKDKPDGLMPAVHERSASRAEIAPNNEPYLTRNRNYRKYPRSTAANSDANRKIRSSLRTRSRQINRQISAA